MSRIWHWRKQKVTTTITITMNNKMYMDDLVLLIIHYSEEEALRLYQTAADLGFPPAAEKVEKLKK